MALIVSREQPRAAVSVAELLRRCAPAPELDHNDAEPIPVSALLRREGRATDDLPRVPDQPSTSAPGNGPAAPAGRKQLVRRGALAAGALLAAGSAFGLVTAMQGTGNQPLASGTYPGEGALDGVAADAPSTTLDSGTAAPTAWMPVAFPTALGGSTVAKIAGAAETATHAAAPAVATNPAHASASTRQTTTARDTTARNTTQPSGVITGTVAGTTKSLGDTVSSVGQNTPVAGVTKAVGTTVDDVGTTVAAVGKTVDGTATPVVNGVVSAATPVVSDATSTVTGAATSTTGTVTKTVTSTAGAVTKTVGGLLG